MMSPVRQLFIENASKPDNEDTVYVLVVFIARFYVICEFDIAKFESRVSCCRREMSELHT